MADERIVAELGRAETPQETADRKAAASRAYRSSQTFRNLIAALLATVAVVAVIIFAVPRGEVSSRVPVDIETAAAEASETYGMTLVAPTAPENWTLNSAQVENLDVPAWTLVYAPSTGFVRVAQGFTDDPEWPSRVLDGAEPDGTVDIAGLTWDTYTLGSASTERNIRYAISTSAGDFTFLIYGATNAEDAATAAEMVTDDIRELRDTTP